MAGNLMNIPLSPAHSFTFPSIAITQVVKNDYCQPFLKEAYTPSMSIPNWKK